MASFADKIAAPPRKRDAERTRAAILAAGTQEFAAHGYGGARIERIAASADCNIRLLYHHFGAKKGLYLAVLEAAYGDLRAREAALALDLADPMGCVEALLRFTFAYFADNPHFEGLLRAENMMQGRFLAQSRRLPEEAVRLRALLGGIVAAGEARGVFRPGVDPVHLYMTIAAFSRFHLGNAWSMSATLGEDLHDPAWKAAWLDHAVAMLRRYVRAGPAAAQVDGVLAGAARETGQG
jgi:AcrR family transcriptional regulator